MIAGTKRRWLLPVFVVVGVLCLFFIAGTLGLPTSTQAELQAGTEGRVLVIPVQLERDGYGLAMVDTVGQTLWIYRISGRGPVHKRLELLAARSWRYDRLLRNYNTAGPQPEQVKMLLENLGHLQKEEDKAKQPDSNMNILEMAEPNDEGSGG
jgi:hypothetical protein